MKNNLRSEAVYAGWETRWAKDRWRVGPNPPYAVRQRTEEGSGLSFFEVYHRDHADDDGVQRYPYRTPEERRRAKFHMDSLARSLNEESWAKINAARK